MPSKKLYLGKLLPTGIQPCHQPIWRFIKAFHTPADNHSNIAKGLYMCVCVYKRIPPIYLFFHTYPSPNLPNQWYSRNCHPNLHLKCMSTCTLMYRGTWKETTYAKKSGKLTQMILKLWLERQLCKMISSWLLQSSKHNANLKTKIGYCSECMPWDDLKRTLCLRLFPAKTAHCLATSLHKGVK